MNIILSIAYKPGQQYPIEIWETNEGGSHRLVASYVDANDLYDSQLANMFPWLKEELNELDIPWTGTIYLGAGGTFEPPEHLIGLPAKVVLSAPGVPDYEFQVTQVLTGMPVQLPMSLMGKTATVKIYRL